MDTLDTIRFSVLGAVSLLMQFSRSAAAKFDNWGRARTPQAPLQLCPTPHTKLAKVSGQVPET